MSVIVPTILSEEPESYKAIIERYAPFANRIHIDIADGEFAPNFTVSADQIWWPKEMKADIHAMVARPEDYIDKLIELQPNLIMLHAEVSTDLLSIMKRIQLAGIKAGVALLRSTVPESVTQYIQAADHVMVFTGELGQYGGKASLMQLEKVRLIKRINPSAEIGWDGGIAIDNAYTLTQGGVDVLNVGGTLATADDPGQVYATLVTEINKHGVI